MHALAKIFAKFCIVLMLISGASGCEAAPASPLPDVSSQPEMSNIAGVSPSCFQPVPNNPLFQNDAHFEGSAWNDPSVLYMNEQFIMYASSKMSDEDSIAIYRLISNDGLAWSLSPKEPVLKHSDDGWDKKSVETPSVVFFNGQYHMFYTGYDTAHTDVFGYKIGHAVSADGVQWSRVGGPIVASSDPKAPEPNFNFDQYIVGEPGAIVLGNQLYVYFTAVGANKNVGASLQVIGLIRSQDGLTWSHPASVMEPEQAVYPRSLGVIGFSTPSAIQIGNEVHLFTDVAREIPGWTQIKLHHAVSYDGINGWAQNKSAIHTYGEMPWAQAEIRSPAPVLVGNDLYLYYAGHTGMNLGIGLSICRLR